MFQMRKKLLLACLALSVLQQGMAQRENYTINSEWSFTTRAVEVEAITPEAVNNWQKVSLPHTWNADDAFDEVEGYGRFKSWYSKKITFDADLKDKKTFLYFEASNQVTDLYINGTHVGNHIGGYTSFCFDITDYLQYGKDNRFVIKVDNSHNADIAPLSADFTFYGGIYRDLSIVTTDKVHFDMLNGGSTGVFLKTPEVTKEKAVLKVTGKFLNESESTRTLNIVHTILNAQGQVVGEMNETVTADARKALNFDQTLTVDKPNLWSPKSPYLYTVVSTLCDQSGEVLDKVRNPLGFRWFKFDPEKGFFINGEHLKLIGTNRHQDYPGMGNALPDEIHRFDMRKLKEMGSNCLRISHYPQDPAVLEMCDKLGFVAFEEIPIVNEITQSEAFEKNCAYNIKEMIMRDFNHPCIVAWNITNEILLKISKYKKVSAEERAVHDKYLRRLMIDLNAMVKELDPTRVTMNVHHGGVKTYQNILDITDTVGWNHYSGWYGSKFSSFDSFVKKAHAAQPNQALLITEYGAGSDPRVHSLNPSRFDFSVEYQTMFNKYYLDVIMREDCIAGANVWNYADFGSEARRDAVPHINNKGIMTYDRRPKDSFYYYKAWLSDKPMVVIPSKLWPVRAGMAESATQLYSKQPIEVYSNLDQVELYLNGGSMGKRKVVDKVATWDVPFEHGENQLYAIGYKNGKPYEDCMKVTFSVYPRDLNSKELPFEEIAVNVGSNCYFIDDAQQNYLWMPDKPYEKGNWGYVGGKEYRRKKDIIGTNQRILGTEIDPIYQTQNIGIKEYKFDVPNGVYELTLLFSDFTSEEGGPALIYNLASDEKSEKAIVPEFSVSANGKSLFKSLNLIQEVGAARAFSRRFTIEVENWQGLTVSFSPEKGETILNGIKLRKVSH